MSDKEMGDLNNHIKSIVNKSISEELIWIGEVMKSRDSDESSETPGADSPHPAEIEHPGDLDLSSGSDSEPYWSNDSDPDLGQGRDAEKWQDQNTGESKDFVKSYDSLQKMLSGDETDQALTGKPIAGQSQSDIEALASKVLFNNEKANGVTRVSRQESQNFEKGVDPEEYVDAFLTEDVPPSKAKELEHKSITYDDILTKKEIMHLLESFKDIYTKDVITQIIRADRIIKKWKETRGLDQTEFDLLINALEFRGRGLFDREIRNLLKMNIIDKVNDESLSTEALACILKIIMSEEN